MLRKLSIKNFALIEKTEVEFDEKLNILSGETGSGKSILLEALNFALGAKADKTLIRSGEEECLVSLEFNIENNLDVKNVLRKFDFDDDDTLIISRRLSTDGKSSIKVNGNSLSLSMLKNLTCFLVDIHGQSEHFFLLDNKNQLALIDNLGGKDIIDIKNEISTLVDEYSNIISSIDELGGDEKNRAIRLDILSYQINEIEQAEILENEEDDLLEKKKKINNLKKINDSLSAVSNCISGDGCVFDSLSNASKMINNICNLSQDYNNIYERLSTLLIELDDISKTSNSLLDDLNIDDLDIDKIESRLDVIKNIKKKYGNTYDEIISFLEQAKNEKSNIENFDELNRELLIKESILKEKLYKLYIELSNIRKKVSLDFTNNIILELKELGFNNSNFYISFCDLPQISDCNFISKNGIDKIEYMFSANIGEPLKPLSLVISGGEISRFMLAIKSQTAKYSPINTFIFDEIDTGISGIIAKIVANKFNKISKNKQIIAITHLPQIAVIGDKNFLIYKEVINEKTVSKISSLDSNGKLNEIIRLIGGNTESESAKNLAIELLKEANDKKCS